MIDDTDRTNGLIGGQIGRVVKIQMRMIAEKGRKIGIGCFIGTCRRLIDELIVLCRFDAEKIKISGFMV